ncbi:hypothetical protein NC653_003615 [Populus alba x Populus x berolinensis]|uniref:DUF3730 domain-containing protein n=1 Tax=Populus alba x Populus x berolinensis TaxID=444605 RepID=A0AAD6RS37_9ROSI|nr:hypothetical protein NC653_003615 [Populus alba x Populus x berolinensis]
MILSSRTEVFSLNWFQQVLLFLGQNRRLGMVEICEFLRPFLNFSILRVPFSNSSSSLFARQLISSMAFRFVVSFPDEAIPVLKLLIGCLKHASLKNSDELKNSYYFLESIVDAYTVVLRHLVGTGLVCFSMQASAQSVVSFVHYGTGLLRLNCLVWKLSDAILSFIDVSSWAC